MAKPAKDRRAFETTDAPLSPTEEAHIETTESGKPYPVVTKHGGRTNDRAIDPKVFEDGKLTKSAQTAALFRKAVALRLADWSIPDIAQELGCAPGFITRLFVEFRQKVDLEAIAARLDQTAVPLAVDNLIHGLLAGDKDYTLETLKGRGVFQRHTAGGDGMVARELPQLRVEFVTPAGAARVEVGSATDPGTLGKVVGAIAVPLDGLPPAPDHRPDVDVPQVSGVPLAPDDADPR